MKQEDAVFITDCEGPISKNDNAFELTCHFIPDGDRFFTLISRYDDIQADIVKRPGYKPGDTLKLILPFLKAYGCLLYTSPSPRDRTRTRMPSSA